MKQSVVLLWFLFCAGHATAQIKWQEDRPLAWADFEGPVDDSNPYAAITSTNIHYSYHVHYAQNVYTLTFEVDCWFLPARSWTKPAKQTAALLRHEQLHFDIKELYARKLLAAFKAATYAADYKEAVKTIFDNLSTEAKNTEIRYDAETDHSLQKEKQLEWERSVHEQLQVYDKL